MEIQDLPRDTFENKYRCLKILHRGASGQVCLVNSRTEGFKYAQLVVKEFNCAKMSKSEYMLMLNEIDITTLLRCSRIPSIIETFYNESEHKVYHVMSYCSNGPLSVYIRRMRAKKERVPESIVWKCLIGCLEALLYMDSYNLDKHVVHRSIKPDNILLDANYVGFLTDFGIAKEKHRDELLKQLCGSRNYLAPEMLARKEYTESVDIWALGAVIYELCTLSPLAIDASPNTADPVYTQQFISSINLTCKHAKSKDNEPYSQDLHRILALMLQLDPKNRASASILLSMPIVAAIRRYINEEVNIVLDFLEQCRDDAPIPQYKIIHKVYRNKTGTHVIVKKHTSGALYWAKEIRVEDDTGNTIVAAAHEHIIHQRLPAHPMIISCIQCVYRGATGRILFVYDNTNLRFEQYTKNKPQLSNLVFLDEFVKYNREKRQQVSEHIIWSILLQLLTLLDWFHNKNRLVFRYLSLETVLINPISNSIMIFDFGLATLYQYPSGRIGSVECMAPEVQKKAETQMGSTVETKLYTSPSAHHTYTNKCDMWSLGCIVYRLMTYLPFYSKYYNRAKGCYGSLKDISFENKFVFMYSPYSRTLETVVRLLLMKDPEIRYSASQLLKKINLSWLERNIFGSASNIEQRSISSSYTIEAIITDAPLFREFILLSSEALAEDGFSLSLQTFGFTEVCASGKKLLRGQRFLGRALRISSDEFMSGNLSSYVFSQIKFSRLLTDECFVPLVDLFFDSQVGVVFVYDCHPDMSLSSLCKQRFQHNQSFLEQEIWSILAQVLVALSKLHSFSANGLNLGSIYHSNLNLDCIFIGLDGTVQTLISGYTHEHEQAGVLSTTFCGSIPYSAPEKLALIGQPSFGIEGYNEKNDVWALGCILYKLCSDGHSFYELYDENRNTIISTGHTKMLLDGLIQWSDTLIEFMALMLTLLPEYRPSAVSLLEHPYLTEAILPYIGSFPLALPQKKFDRRYLILDQYGTDFVFETDDDDLTSRADTSIPITEKTISTPDIPQNTKDTFLVQSMQQLNIPIQDASTTNSLKVTLKDDKSRQFIVREFPLNKLLPLSIQELCEMMTAMRTLFCEFLEKPVDSFIDNSYVYVITEYVHDLPLSVLLQLYKERHARMPERYIWKIAYVLLSAIQQVDSKGYAFGAISPGSILLTSKMQIAPSITEETPSNYSCLRSDYEVLLSDYSMAHAYGKPFTRNISSAYEPYLAPEVLAGKHTKAVFFTPTADIWAIGATLFEVCFNISFSQYLLENESVTSALKLGKLFKMPSSIYSQNLIELLRMMLVVDSTRRQTAMQLLKIFEKEFNNLSCIGIGNFLIPFSIPCVRASPYSVLKVLSEDKENQCRLLRVKRNAPIPTPMTLSMQRSGMLRQLYEPPQSQSEADYFCQEVKLAPNNQRIIHQLLFLSTALFFYHHVDLFTNIGLTTDRIGNALKDCPFLTALVDVFDDCETGCMCIITEATDDGTAADLLESLKKSSLGLTQEQFRRISEQLLRTLERIYLPTPFYVATMQEPLMLNLCHAGITLSNIMLLSDGTIKLNIFHSIYPTGVSVSPQIKASLGPQYVQISDTLSHTLDFWCLGSSLFALYTHRTLQTVASNHMNNIKMEVSTRSQEESLNPLVHFIRTTSLIDLINASLPIYLNHLKSTPEHASVVKLLQGLFNGTTNPESDLFMLRRIMNPELNEISLNAEQEPVEIEKPVEPSLPTKSEEDSLTLPHQFNSMLDNRRLTIRDDTSDVVESVIHRSSLYSTENSIQVAPTGVNTNVVSTPTQVQATEEPQDQQIIDLLKKKFGSSVLRNKYLIVNDEETSNKINDTIYVRPLNASIATKEIYTCQYVDILAIETVELRNAIILEAQLLLSFTHENIRKYIDVFYDKSAKKLCIISECLSNFTLADILMLYSENNTPIEEHSIWKCADELLSALAYIQQFKNSMGKIGTFANLSISPHSIRFAPRDDMEPRITTLKLCDFTCCVYLGDPITPGELNTRTAILSSNDAYMHQDAIQTKYGYMTNYDALLQDIWSVGVILYEISTLHQFHSLFYDANMATHAFDIAQIDINIKHNIWAPQRNYTQDLNNLITAMLKGQTDIKTLIAMVTSSEILQSMKSLDATMPRRHLKDDYEIIDFLCDMSISRLYKVRNLLNGYILTCKETVLTSINGHIMQFLELETSIMKQLSHENIAPLLDHFYDRDKLSIYIITDFFQFGSITSMILRYLGKGIPIPEETIWGIACETLKGLEYLHSPEKTELRGLKIVHRNIRPDSLFLTKDGKVHIFDFCLAKVLSNTSTADNHRHFANKIYASAGTLGYMAPEVLLLRGKDVDWDKAGDPAPVRYDGYDEKCDIWSLGAVLYELCTFVPLADKQPTLREDGKDFSAVTSLNPEGIAFPEDGSWGADREYYSLELLSFINLLLQPFPTSRLSAQELLHTPKIKAFWATPDSSDYEEEEKIDKGKKLFDTTRYTPVSPDPQENIGLNIPSLSDAGEGYRDHRDVPTLFNKTDESESGISVAGIRAFL